MKNENSQIKLSENELWLLSFYRTSEISGALFFGQLAKSFRPGPIQRDMTKHFSDESMHSWYWTECIEKLGGRPLKLNDAYQDQYLAAAGMPTNIMEVLAITQVFERRVVNQYAKHFNVEGLHPIIAETIKRIMIDERWHIEWIKEALVGMEGDYGKSVIDETMKRYQAADEEVYRHVLKEHEQRLSLFI